MSHGSGDGPVERLYRLGVGGPDPAEAVEWEIEHHLQEQADRLVAEGWEPGDARREAERRFGKARHGPRLRRHERRRGMMRKTTGWAELVRDAVAATWRSARRQPGFALGVVLTLALGIGANAAMFGIVDRLLLRPPAHVQEHEEVWRLVMARSGNLYSTVTFPDFMDQRANDALEAVAAYTPARENTMGSGPDAVQVRAALVSHEFFDLLGVAPVMGRDFAPEDDAPEAPATAVVSREFWQERLGGAPDVLGRTLEISGVPHTVIGVAPAGFTGVELSAVDVWLPIEATQALRSGGTDWKDGEWSRNNWWLRMVGRLGDGVTVDAATDQATALTRNARRADIENDERGRWADLGIRFTPLIAAHGPSASADSRVATWLGGVAVLVLLIACANVTNLFLARGAQRRREVAVRLALGVGRSRLVGQLVLNATALALVGGLAALAIARWGGEIVRSTLLPNVLFQNHALDGRVVLFTLALSCVAGVLAGIGPALQSTRCDLSEDLAEGGRGSAASSSRVRGGLIVAQAALTVVLLVGAGLFLRSMAAVRSLEHGLDVDRVAASTLEMTDRDLPREEVQRVYDLALARLAGMPGVESATATSAPFMWAFGEGIDVPGLDSIPRLPGGGPYYQAVMPGYFRTVGLEVLRGRALSDIDGPGDDRVVVVSRTMAESLWPEEDPLGRCVMRRDSEECSTVVGVVEDASRGSLQEEAHMMYYVPAAQGGEPMRAVYVRTADGSSETLSDLAAVLREVSPHVRYAGVELLRDALDPQARSWALGATMFSVFGILALIVAGIGLYSLLAFEVAQRVRELGIRSALGAGRSVLLRGVIARGTRLVAAGVVVGLATAWFVAPRVEALLFEVSPRDPAVLAAVALALAATALVAGLVPGLRATRVDPAEALRSE